MSLAETFFQPDMAVSKLMQMIFDIEFNAGGLLPSKGLLEAAKIADEKDFGMLWKGESNSRAPAVLLSAVAAVTKRIGIGCSVFSIFAHSPVELGMLSATLDELSDGRFVLGVGASNRTLATWFGQSFSKPLKMVEEYVGIVRSVFARKKLETRGEFFSSVGFKLTFHPAHENLRIVIAALGPKMAQLAGRIGDGVMTNYAEPGRINFIHSNFMKGLKEAGRDPQGKEIITKVRCAVNEDREKAKVTLKRQMVYHMLADYYADAFSEMGFRDEVAGVKSTFLKSGYNESVKYLISNERSDEMLSRLALIPATSVRELKTELRKYADVKATRISVDYKPSTDHPVEEVLQFLREW